MPHGQSYSFGAVSVPQKWKKRFRYPYCRGIFPDCPSEVDSRSLAPECMLCPFAPERLKLKGRDRLWIERR